MAGDGLDLLIGGRPLSTYTSAWGDMVLTHQKPSGSWELTLGVILNRRDPATFIQPEALATAVWKGTPVWCGNVLDGIDADGQLVLTGAIRESETPPALDGSSVPTNVPDTGFDAALARGAIHGTRYGSFGATAAGDPAADPTQNKQSIGQLLDLAADAAGKTLWVDPWRRWRMDDPSTIGRTWYVMPGTAELRWTRQDSPDRLIGWYFDHTGAGHTVSVGTGSREQTILFPIDGPRGPLDATTATGLLTTLLKAAQAGGWKNQLELSVDQITSPGGVSPHPSLVTANDTFVLLDQPDPRPGIGLPSTSVACSEVVWTTADSTLTVTPQGADSAEFTKVLAQMGAVLA